MNAGVPNDVVHDRFNVDCIVDCLTDFDVVERRSVGAQHYAVDGIADDLLEVDVLESHDRVDLVRGHLRHGLISSFFWAGDPRGSFLDDLEMITLSK